MLSSVCLVRYHTCLSRCEGRCQTSSTPANGCDGDVHAPLAGQDPAKMSVSTCTEACFTAHDSIDAALFSLLIALSYLLREPACIAFYGICCRPISRRLWLHAKKVNNVRDAPMDAALPKTGSRGSSEAGPDWGHLKGAPFCRDFYCQLRAQEQQQTQQHSEGLPHLPYYSVQWNHQCGVIQRKAAVKSRQSQLPSAAKSCCINSA